MGCDKCDRETEQPTATYYYRIGTKESGWGKIALIGCKTHVKQALDKLNEQGVM